MAAYLRGYSVLDLSMHTETSAPSGVLSFICTLPVFYPQGRALYYACEHGDDVRARELLSEGANINYRYEGEVRCYIHVLHK